MVRKALERLVLVTAFAGSLVLGGCNKDNQDSQEKPKTEQNTEIMRVDFLNDFAYKTWQENSEKSFEILDSAQKSAESLNYEKGITDALIRRGVIRYFKGEYESAKENYLKYLEIKKNIGDSLGIGKAYNNLGTISDKQGKYDEAVEYYIGALKIYENLSDSVRMARTYNNLGMISDKRNKNEIALEYYNKSLDIKENLNDSLGVAVTLNNIAIIFNKQNENEKAFKYYEKSLSIANKLKNNRQISISLNNLASLHKKKGELDKALDYFFQSKKLNEEIGDKEGLALNLMNMGRIYKEKENFSKSLESSEEALSIAKKINNPELLKNIFGSLSETYEKKEGITKALSYYKNYSALEDSLFNIESSKQIAEAETKYQTEKKEQENKLLRKDNELQLAKNEQQLTKNKQQRMINYSIGGFALLLIGGVSYYYRQTKIKEKQRKEIAFQKKIVDEKSKEVTESIQYASILQRAVLPNDEEVKRILGEDSFVLYKPKDIVSGDFYWMTQKNGKSLFAACDCTGHGVPGALMHMSINAFLNEAVNEKQLEKPNEIFDDVKNGIMSSLKEQKDGMDSILCSWDKEQNTLEFACANNPLYLIRDDEIIKYKKDKMCVGYEDELKPFTYNKIDLKKNDLIYIFSDGFQDQFGGQRGKKFGPKNLRELLILIKDESMTKQKESLDKTFSGWKGNLEQVDDVLMIGLRV